MVSINTVRPRKKGRKANSGRQLPNWCRGDIFADLSKYDASVLSIVVEDDIGSEEDVPRVSFLVVDAVWQDAVRRVDDYLNKHDLQSYDVAIIVTFVEEEEPVYYV